MPAKRERAKRSGIGWLGLIGLLIALVIGSFLLLGEEAGGPFLLFVLGFLAVLGIFTLFAAAIGLVRFGEGAPVYENEYPFLESLEGAHVLTDAEGRIVFADRAYKRLIDAVNDHDVRSIEHVFGVEEGLSEPIYRLSVAASEGRAFSEEVRLEHALDRREQDRSPRWYRVSVRPVRSQGDGLLDIDAKTIWRVEDITRDREDQEVAFQELQSVINYLDHAPAGFLSAEPDGKIVYLNATLAGWLRLDLAAFESGRLYLHDIVRGDGAALLNAIQANPGEVRTETIDIDFVQSNGQSLPVRLLHLTPFQMDGAPGATRTIVLNRAEQEVDAMATALNDAQFSRFFNASPIAIASIDQKGVLVQTNAPFIRLFDFKGQPGKGVSIASLISEADMEKLSEALEAAADRQGEIDAIDVTMRADTDKSARIFVNSVANGSAHSSNEDKAGEVAVLYVIETTKQRALEQQFAQGQKMQAIGQLAGGIAHDFNNMLTAIIGFSDLLLAKHGPTDASFQDLMNIKNNANRAAGLVRQLLAFSRRQTLRPKVVDMRDVIEDLSILLERLLGENVKLAVNHGRDLWSVKADVNQLEQVIMNLSVNARDAMPEGGDLKISTYNVAPIDCDTDKMKGLQAGEYVAIEVSDTGTGMPPEVMEKIFEPFFSTKDVGQGTGLGLATVYGIIKQTGGYIYPESEEGKGTTFSILLPRHMAEEKEVEPAPVKDTPVDVSGSARILLVEDEEAVRAFSSRALEARGHTVHAAANGELALELMQELDGEIDLVVSDVVMPEMDGPTLLGELRKVQPDLKIIFVSGYAEDAFEKHLAEGEKFAFLSKPFTLKQLTAKVKEVLDGADA